MRKFRIKIRGVYDHIFDVQMKMWYGWANWGRYDYKEDAVAGAGE